MHSVFCMCFTEETPRQSALNRRSGTIQAETVAETRRKYFEFADGGFSTKNSTDPNFLILILSLIFADIIGGLQSLSSVLKCSKYYKARPCLLQCVFCPTDKRLKKLFMPIVRVLLLLQVICIVPLTSIVDRLLLYLTFDGLLTVLGHNNGVCLFLWQVLPPFIFRKLVLLIF